MQKRERLLGVDLCRGIAAYAVVAAHSGDEAWKVPIEESVLTFRHLFYFAVPFFLATSFYFTVNKPTIWISSNFWRSRIERVLIPYIIWSIIYFVCRTLLFSATHQSSRLNEYLSDPIATIFFGAASFQLYFLPLLFSGTSLIYFSKYLVNQRINIFKLILFLLVSFLLYQSLIDTGNSFELGPYIAFRSALNLLSANSIAYTLARLILVPIAWIIRCLPYVIAAVILSRVLSSFRNLGKLYRSSASLLLFTLFIYLNILGQETLPASCQEVFVAYTLFLLGLSLSRRLGKNQIVASLGICSFGIYLIHPFMVNLVKIVFSKILPELTNVVSIYSILALSIPSFLLSWLIISRLLKCKKIAKYLLGVIP